MPLSRRQVSDALIEHLDGMAAAGRKAAAEVSIEGQRQRQNRASADLILVAQHIGRQDETHQDLSELYAWEDAQDRVGPCLWHPNPAQAAAIETYADDPSARPDFLLAELNRLK